MLSGATVAVTARRNEGQKREREGAFREMIQCCREGQRNCERFRIFSGEGDNLFEAHREVEGADVLGQGAYGDVIDAGFSKFADGVERHVAGHQAARPFVRLTASRICSVSKLSSMMMSAPL